MLKAIILILALIAFISCGNATSSKKNDTDLFPDSDNTAVNGDLDNNASQDSDKISNSDTDSGQTPDEDFTENCSGNSTRCNNGMVQTCDNGKFKNTENCSAQSLICAVVEGNAKCVKDATDEDTAVAADNNDTAVEDFDIFIDTDTAIQDHDVASADKDSILDKDTMPDADTGPSADHCLKFNGTSSSVTIPHNAAFNLGDSWTVEVWYNLTSVSDTNQVIIRKGASDIASGSYYLYCNSITAGYNNSSSGGVSVDSAVAPTVNEWHHLAMVKTSTALTVYFDGLKKETGATSGLAVTANISALVFGANLYSGYYFNGLLDEVRISNTARYTGDFTPAFSFSPDASTIALWHFSEGSGSTVTDEIGGYTGTLSNVTWDVR